MYTASQVALQNVHLLYFTLNFQISFSSLHLCISAFNQLQNPVIFSRNICIKGVALRVTTQLGCLLSDLRLPEPIQVFYLLVIW